MESFKNWLPALFVMAVIYVASSTSGTTIAEVGANKEYILVNGHLILFFVLCMAFYKATKDIPTSVIFTIFYGVLDELHQVYTQLRNPSVFDIKIDAIAALIAGLILWKLQHILPVKLKNWLNK